MEDAGHAVAPFPDEVEILAVFLVVEGELQAVNKQLLDNLRSFAGQVFDRLGIIVAPAAGEHIALQQLWRVFIAAKNNAALGQGTVAVVQVVARGQQNHFQAGIGQGQGGGQAGNAGPHHQGIGMHAVQHESIPLPARRGRAFALLRQWRAREWVGNRGAWVFRSRQAETASIRSTASRAGSRTASGTVTGVAVSRFSRAASRLASVPLAMLEHSLRRKGRMVLRPGIRWPAGSPSGFPCR